MTVLHWAIHIGFLLLQVWWQSYIMVTMAPAAAGSNGTEACNSWHTGTHSDNMVIPWHGKHFPYHWPLTKTNDDWLLFGPLGIHWLLVDSPQKRASNCGSFGNKANLRDLIAATGQVISIWIQIVNFSARVTVKFDGWPRKTIGHFFCITSSFVHHFKSIGEFKLDLQSRNAQFGSKLVICYPVWPWYLMDDLGKQ